MTSVQNIIISNLKLLYGIENHLTDLEGKNLDKSQTAYHITSFPALRSHLWEAFSLQKLRHVIQACPLFTDF
jgi:hypothetical protein